MTAAHLSAKNSPLVSICLPVRNGGTYLREALDSVLAQTYPSFELLVFDNASTDTTWETLQGFRDPRIRCVRNLEDIGAERNWNLALNSATGAYVKMMHHDDLLAPGCLAEEVAVLEECPGAVLTFSSRSIIGPDGRRFMTRTAPWPQGEVSGKRLMKGCIRGGTNRIGECCGVLFRTGVARETGTFDGHIPYLIDLDYWFRLLEHGSGYCLKAPLASYRISKSQWSAEIGRKQCQQFIDFIDYVQGRQVPVHLWEALLGKAMAYRNQCLRMLVYRLLTPGRK